MERINWNTSGDAATQSTVVLHEVVQLCQSRLSLDLVVSNDSTGFSTRASEEKPDGIQSATAKLLEEDVLLIRLELVRADRIARIDAGAYFEHLSRLGPRVNLVPPEQQGADTTSLWVELRVKASPMTPIRENAFLDELDALQRLSRSLQSDLAYREGDKALVKQYKEFKDNLEPILPLRADMLQAEPELVSWARQVHSFISGGHSVAIQSPYSVEIDYALAALAAGQMDTGSSLG